MAKPAKNLIPNSERTPRELREITQKGGIASGKSRRKKRLFRDIIEQALACPIKDSEKRAKLAAVLGVEEATVMDDVLCALLDKASAGDTKAIAMILELNDGKQTQTIDLQSGGQAFKGFESVLPNVEGIEKIICKVEEHRRQELDE